MINGAILAGAILAGAILALLFVTGILTGAAAAYPVGYAAGVKRMRRVIDDHIAREG